MLTPTYPPKKECPFILSTVEEVKASGQTETSCLKRPSSRCVISWYSPPHTLLCLQSGTPWHLWRAAAAEEQKGISAPVRVVRTPLNLSQLERCYTSCSSALAAKDWYHQAVSDGRQLRGGD